MISLTERKYMYMLLRIRISLIIALWFFSGKMLVGQFSVEGYLTAPFKDSEIVGLARQLEFMESESFRSPLFRELEIRLRSNDFNASPEDFRLRLGFVNPVEQRRNNNYNEAHSEYLEAKYNFEANLLLANRYKQLVRHYYLQNYIQILEDEINILEAAGSHLQYEKLSVKEWIDTDSELLEYRTEKNDLNASLEILENTLTSVHDLQYPITWNEFDMITVNSITEQLLLDSVYMSESTSLAMKELRLEEKEYMLNKAESWSNIGFIQAEYDTERGNGIDDHLGFQLGITLPVFNVDKPKLQRDKLDLIQHEADVQEILSNSILDAENIRVELLNQIRNYNIITRKLDMISSFALDASFENFEDYLSVLTYIGELKIMQNDFYYDCLISYINLKAQSGQLGQTPLKVIIRN